MIHYISLVHNLVLYKMEKGEINIESKEALKCVLQEHEIHTQVIEKQLEMCKKDHVDLKTELNRLVEENRDLFLRLKVCTDNAFQREGKSAFVGQSQELENLQQRLALALEAQKDYTEAIMILESRLSASKSENDQLTVKTQMLENQLLQVSSQMALITEKNLTLNNSLKEAIAQEQEWKSRYLMLEAKYLELDKSYQSDKVKFAHSYQYEKVESQLNERLEGALRQRDELQTALERCHERMADLMRSAASDRSRIEEAVSLVEGAMRGRDEALTKEAVSTEEVTKLRMELKTLVGEAGVRVAQEVAAVRKQFDSQLTSLKDQLRVVEQDRSRKCVEVQQLQKECERLQTVLQQGPGQPDVSNRRDKQLGRVYQELHTTETDCLQLVMENEALRSSLAKLQDRCQKNSQDKIKLKHDLHNSELQSQLYQHELAVTTQRADLLNTQLHEANLELAQLQGELITQRENVGCAQSGVSITNTLELYKRIDDSYGQMSDKWKNEMNALTEKFETKLNKIKSKTENYERRKGVSKNSKSEDN